MLLVYNLKFETKIQSATTYTVSQIVVILSSRLQRVTKKITPF